MSEKLRKHTHEMKAAWKKRTISSVTWRLIGIRLLYRITNVRKFSTKSRACKSENRCQSSKRPIL